MIKEIAWKVQTDMIEGKPSEHLPEDSSTKVSN
jgi:hypothetical protein